MPPTPAWRWPHFAQVRAFSTSRRIGRGTDMHARRNRAAGPAPTSTRRNPQVLPVAQVRILPGARTCESWLKPVTAAGTCGSCRASAVAYRMAQSQVSGVEPITDLARFKGQARTQRSSPCCATPVHPSRVRTPRTRRTTRSTRGVSILDSKFHHFYRPRETGGFEPTRVTECPHWRGEVLAGERAQHDPPRSR